MLYEFRRYALLGCLLGSSCTTHGLAQETPQSSLLYENDVTSGNAEGFFRFRTSDTTDSERTSRSALTKVNVAQDLSAEVRARRDRIRRVLSDHFQRRENAASRSPWGIMHTLIAYGVDTKLNVQGRQVNAIGWLCWNGSGRGQRMFYTSNGQIRAYIGPGNQGHEGQFLAMLAQSRVRTDYPMKIGGREFTVKDLVESEKLTCRPGTELTFKLIGLSHYLPSNAQWKSQSGEDWDIPRLIREELAQPVIGAACGGSHRMMGFSYAVRKREQRGESFTGEWRRAQKYVNDYHKYALKLQNPDGSFSTSWFEGRGSYGNAARHLETTGHVLEWLVFSLPKQRLSDPQITKAVDFLTNLFLEHPNYRWSVGARGHALHALAMYDERVFGSKPGARMDILVKKPVSPTASAQPTDEADSEPDSTQVAEPREARTTPVTATDATP